MSVVVVVGRVEDERSWTSSVVGDEMGAALSPSTIFLRHDVSCLSRTNSRPIQPTAEFVSLRFTTKYNKLLVGVIAGMEQTENDNKNVRSMNLTSSAMHSRMFKAGEKASPRIGARSAIQG